MQRRVRRWCGGISPPLSNFGNVPEKSVFLYDQKVGDQFTLKFCLEIDPYFWTKCIKIMKFYVGAGVNRIFWSPPPPNGKGPVRPFAEVYIQQFLDKLYCPGGRGGREMFSPSKGVTQNVSSSPGGWRGGRK